MDSLALAVAIPVVAAACLVGVGSFVRGRVADLIALAAVVAALALLVDAAARIGFGTEVYWFGAWQPRGGTALGVDFAVDGVGAGMAILIALLTVAALVLMWRYRDTDAPHFQVLMLLFFAGMVGFSLSGDLFNMFVFFELMSVAAFALAGYQVESESVEGSLNFAVTNTIGSFLVVLGIGLVYARTGALNLAQAGAGLASGPHDGLVAVAFCLLAAGFLIKAAIVPFHFWLADAYAVAPTPVCLLFAGAMSELGIYAVARLWFTVFDLPLAEHAAELRAILIVAGCVTALLGAAMCLAQANVKRTLAFVTISYAGVLLICVGLLSADGIAAASMYTVADGFAKAALFAAVGIIHSRTAGLSERQLQGRVRGMTGTAVVFILGVLSLLALPPFGSFYAKAILEDGLNAAGYGWVIAVVVVATALTTAAVAAMALRIFVGIGDRPRSGDRAAEETETELSEPEGRTPPSLLAPALGCGFAALVVGLIPSLLTAVQRTADRFADTTAYAATVLHDAAGAVPAEPPPFEAKPTAYVYAVVGTLLAALVTVVRLHPRRPRALLGDRLLDRPASVFGGLRALHSGHIGDYVAFLCAGVAALGVALAVAIA